MWKLYHCIDHRWSKRTYEPRRGCQRGRRQQGLSPGRKTLVAVIFAVSAISPLYFRYLNGVGHELKLFLRDFSLTFSWSSCDQGMDSFRPILVHKGTLMFSLICSMQEEPDRIWQKDVGFKFIDLAWTGVFLPFFYLLLLWLFFFVPYSTQCFCSHLKTDPKILSLNSILYFLYRKEDQQS